MSDFLLALPRTLAREGGYSNDSADRGGATNLGISAEFLKSIGDPRHPAELTMADVRTLYRKHFWDAFSLDKVADQRIAEKVFDIHVNMGPAGAARVAQRALRCLGTGITEDGAWGPKTREAVDAAPPEKLLIALRSEQAGRYRQMGVGSQSKFLNGWLRRAYDED